MPWPPRKPSEASNRCIEPPLPPLQPGGLAEQLRHDRRGADAARQGVAVLAVGAGDVVVRAECREAADRHRLLADVEVAESADLAQAVRLAGLLLEPADEHHLAEPAPVLLGPGGIEPAPAGAGAWAPRCRPSAGRPGAGRADLLPGVIRRAGERARLHVREPHGRARGRAARRTRRACSSGPPGRWLSEGRRYWPSVRMLTSLRRRSRMQTSTSSHSSPMPRMMPHLVSAPGSMRRALASSAERPVVAPAGPGQAVQPLGGLEIVVEDVGPGVHHDPERLLRALEVGDQHLDRGVGQPPPDLGDAAGEGLGAAVGQVVAVHRRDHDVRQPHPLDRLGQPHRLQRVERRRACRGRPRSRCSSGCRRRPGS